MLKTQIVRAFYFCNSFVLITAPFTANPIPSRAATVAEDKNGLETSSLNNGYEINRNIPGRQHFNLTYKKAPLRSHEPQTKLNRTGMLFVKNYIKNSNVCLYGIKKRSVIPFYIIDSIFKKYGLPVELKYLAVIESELKPSALSQVGARGPWQLMPSTARDLGLKVTRQYDERTNYYKSTQAAAMYLRDLYVQFDDWLLVLAAYNGGPKPVYTAIRESGSRNFWVLENDLPAESREHVKKFIATHYYFEGRGGVTTLTRSENVEYRKTVNQFLKSTAGTEISGTKTGKQGNTNTTLKSKNLAVHYDMKQKAGSEKEVTDTSPGINQNVTRQFESPEQKFRRVMKESEESLTRSRKIIQGTT
ncbi:MAG TPA: lytic transglycosylase [Chitinophagaceae bacterium]|jgi:membrane-bound lytic murein transglycosylase D|nr:lytic transglycosylase [Chitinophagaceae bacterium]